MKVLVIEDDEDVVDTVTLAFRVGWLGTELISTHNGGKGIELVESESPDIVILDLGLPDMSGFAVLREIRTFSEVPVIILTVMVDEDDIIKGLEWGADDYVIKPFRKMELLARIKTILRRHNRSADEYTLVRGPLRFEPATRQFFYLGREISLTVTEGNLLYHLMKNSGQVVTHSGLAEMLWGDDYPGGTDTIKVHIRHLREKLETDPSQPQLILTKSGVGYFLVAP